MAAPHLWKALSSIFAKDPLFYRPRQGMLHSLLHEEKILVIGISLWLARLP